MMSQQRKFLTTVAFLAFIGIFNSHVIRGQQFNLENINLWADQIGNELNRIGYEILDLNKIENIYQKQDFYVQNLNGSFLIQQLARNLRETFSTKVAALQNLVDAVQILANDKLTNLTELRQLHYYDSLSSNITSELTMTYSTKFKTLINSSLSVIQIPTNVYSGSRSILATIEYTKNLNDYFIENYNNDPNLRNQYFGGNDGVFRTFPGRPWPKDESGIVLYDCRQRGWYILGSDSPKNVIILIDRSGSMRGMPLAIAKWGTSNLLDTLNQNDFFTILTFNESITPVIDCYTNLIQATDENKKLYKTYLEKFTDGGRADFNHSYAMAFDLLQNAKTQSFRHSAKCQEAIVLFTDGAAQYTEKLLAERNSEKKIRIITFVVGPQFYDTVPIEKLTCEYNGFLGKIPSMGEVGDAIRQYTEVMNRPLLNDKNHPVKWTSVYWDKLGMGLVTTAVMPAFRFNLTASLNPEQLLGVMATDVPIEMFQQCVPQHLLLPNGYAFVIDNNGLVLFHPGIRATDGYIDNPPPVDIIHLEYGSRIEELRKAMIDRLSGSMTMETKLLYRNYEKGQGVVKRMTYHFMPVVNTSYSVAIAIEDNTGIPISNSCYSKGLEYLNNMTKSEITTKILDWLHCHGDNLHQSSKYDKKFSKNCYHEVTGGLIKSKQDFDKYCNQALFKQLLQDAHSVDILKPPQPALQDDAVANREGICDTFISTFSGLTKYYTLISGQRCCSILGSRQCLEKGNGIEVKNTSRQDHLYDRIVSELSVNQSLFTYRLQHRIGTYYSFLVTKPIIIGKSNKFLRAVAGMEMTFRRFRSIITSVPLLNENPTLNCFNLTNKNKGMTCFILDENAFVLDTNLEIAEIGKSLAIVDNQLLESLIAHDVYTRNIIWDYQGVCSNAQTSNSASRIMNPVISVFNYFSIFTTSFFSFLTNFNMASVLTYLGSFLYGKADGAYIDIRPDNRSCMYIRQFILAGTHATSRIAGNITCNSDNSTRAFFISPINNTNLKLVIVEESKSELCNNNSVSVPTAEQIKNRTCTEDGNYRKGPEFCFKKITPVPTKGCSSALANFNRNDILLCCILAVLLNFIAM